MEGLRENRGGKRNERDKQQMEGIKYEEPVICANYVIKHRVVIDPDSANDDKANDICEIRGPETQELSSQSGT